MFSYLADAILLVIVGSIPYVVSHLRLSSSRSRRSCMSSQGTRLECLKIEFEFLRCGARFMENARMPFETALEQEARSSQWQFRSLVQEANSAIPVSSRYSASVNCNDAADTFSSRCATEEVPGMGSMTGDRFSNHANAT